MRKVVFDIETKGTFTEAGSNDPASLEISVLVIHDSETDSFSSFTEENLAKLWPILEKTDLLIGFNSDHFDLPLLNKYYPGDLGQIKSLDILKEIKSSYGRRMKLDQLAEATLGIKKSGNGLEAITWWKNGEIDKIIKYCEDDVRITKNLYDYALKNQKLIFKEAGDIREIKLDTSKWEEKEDSGITHTLPF